MKRCINAALLYAVLAMAGGVFYREFTTFNGFTGKTTLSVVHTHYFLLGMVFLFILLLYRFAAPLDKPSPPVVPGALAASAALAAASAIFSLLMGNSARYSLVYGSLASVIIMLVWLYLCGNILIMGNVVNFVLFTHRKEARR